VSLDLLRLGETVKAAFDLKPFDAPPPSLETVDKGVALLRIPDFSEDAAAQVRNLLAQARQRAAGSGMLIDLRGVSMGDPAAAYEMAKLFANGDLGALKRRDEEIETYKGQAAPLWQGKLVLLVDRGTLGPAEIFATVLRQKLKAELVGERTFGYAGRQDMAQLSTGGRLLLTDAFYTGPDRVILNESLRPDLLVSERVRTYLERDVTIPELILRRGVSRLLGEDSEAAAKKAA
jgi:carboxyl-terminal processing protease